MKTDFDIDFADGDCSDTLKPVCPYCKLPNHLDWDNEQHALGDGDQWERKCVFCGEQYPVVTTITYFFTTVKYDEDRVEEA